MARREPRTRPRSGRREPPRSAADPRGPLPGSLPRRTKRRRGPASPATLPAHVRALGVELVPGERAYIRGRLGMKLGKFAARIERISVRLEDVNGPRGGVDHECRIKVVLSSAPSVVVSARDPVLRAAVDRALDATQRATRRALQRRRTVATRGR